MESDHIYLTTKAQAGILMSLDRTRDERFNILFNGICEREARRCRPLRCRFVLLDMPNIFFYLLICGILQFDL